MDFSEPIINMLRITDTDTPILHLLYEMWVTLIEKCESYFNMRRKTLIRKSEFFDVLYEILVSRWNKSLTPLHYDAHSFNLKYYSNAWVIRGGKGVKHVAPNKDMEVSGNQFACFDRRFPQEKLKRG